MHTLVEQWLTRMIRIFQILNAFISLFRVFIMAEFFGEG